MILSLRLRETLFLNSQDVGLGCNSVVEYLGSLHKALSLIPNTRRQQQKQQKKTNQSVIGEFYFLDFS